MKRYLPLLLTLLYSCSTSESPVDGSQETFSKALWQITDGLVHPESVIFDKNSGRYFISNIGNDESNESPDGFVTTVDLNGKMLELKWVDSIQSPKGQCIVNNNYYVSALDELLEIDLETGNIKNRYTTDDIQFLNDVASDRDGNVYVSGMRENAIYKLDTAGNFTIWFQNDSLHHPNGLFAFEDNLYVGGWGNMDDNEAGIDTVGHFMKIDLTTKNFSYLTKDKPGKLDGIQAYNNEFLVSSWKAGEIFKMDNVGNHEAIMTTPTSVGDILYLAEDSLLILPLNFQHEVRAYSFP